MVKKWALYALHLQIKLLDERFHTRNKSSVELLFSERNTIENWLTITNSNDGDDVKV